ncbi:hypothetical protein D5018_19290 [Parashewanella curva]|uniref:Uncharacterized protein n=1 Tax=Parashewanella curva TaxID=2338552 RepID=A0A3L8PVF8_9GAMM|nr:hypothetical protein [Parashewanella curva]RLV58052.1 hypothetical protein D5018_19290 [Parashewanella curva]
MFEAFYASDNMPSSVEYNGQEYIVESYDFLKNQWQFKLVDRAQPYGNKYLEWIRHQYKTKIKSDASKLSLAMNDENILPLKNPSDSDVHKYIFHIDAGSVVTQNVGGQPAQVLSDFWDNELGYSDREKFVSPADVKTNISHRTANDGRIQPLLIAIKTTPIAEDGVIFTNSFSSVNEPPICPFSGESLDHQNVIQVSLPNREHPLLTTWVSVSRSGLRRIIASGSLVYKGISLYSVSVEDIRRVTRLNIVGSLLRYRF